jgi:N-acetyl-anhydromuramyl-L-alanine amidase AmpD
MNFIGIEGENTGLNTDMPWPEVQMDAFRRGVAAILKHIGRTSEFCIGHKEWAKKRVTKRKIDPLFDMDDFRAGVAAIMSGVAPAPVLIPVSDSNGRPTIRRGLTGELTRQVQRKLGVSPDGNFGPATEAAVRKFQRDRDLVPDGIVGPKTWSELDELP